MRLLLLLFAVLGPAASAAGQTAVSTPAASPEPEQSPAADTGDLPVSLDRIRKGLARPEDSLLNAVEKLDREPDFRVEIQERQRFEELIERLKIESTGPAPPGGVYAYEQQQRAFNPVDRPLMQPYAAFSPRELTIVALENIIGQYLARKAFGAIGSAQRTAAERAAREEVMQAIVAYCAVQPQRGAGIEICTLGP
jgi:hypothetical protein